MGRRLAWTLHRQWLINISGSAATCIDKVALSPASQVRILWDNEETMQVRSAQVSNSFVYPVSKIGITRLDGSLALVDRWMTADRYQTFTVLSELPRSRVHAIDLSGRILGPEIHVETPG